MTGDIRSQIGSAYIVVWRNDSGSWKLHRDIWTTSQPVAARV
jgi:hypothetical protein